jgi:hypothetical protein
MRGAWRSHDLPYRSVACLALGGMSGRAAMTRVQIMYRLAVRAVLVQRTHWQKKPVHARAKFPSPAPQKAQ